MCRLVPSALRYSWPGLIFGLVFWHSQTQLAWAEDPEIYASKSSTEITELSIEIKGLGRAGPLKNESSRQALKSMILGELKAEYPVNTEIVPGVADFKIDEKIFEDNPSKKFNLHSQFALSGKEIATLQAKTRTYYDPNVYSGPSGKTLLRKTLEGKSKDGEEAFKAKGRIVVSEDYMLYHKDRTPIPAAERVPFKIFSQPGINVAYGQHDHGDYDKFVKSNELLKEGEFLKYLKENLTFQLKTMEQAGVEVPILPAIGGGAFSRGFQPRYSELVAQAYREVLESTPFAFKSVVFALPVVNPSVNPEDNLHRYRRAFSGSVPGTSGRYAGNIPVILADTDMVEVAHTLGGRYKTGVINPADSYSIAGMYWDGGDTVLEEHLALRTTLLLTQHLRLNPGLLDQNNYVPTSVSSSPSSSLPYKNSGDCKTLSGGPILPSLLNPISQTLTTLESKLGRTARETYLDQMLATELAWTPMYQTFDPLTGRTSGGVVKLASPFLLNEETAAALGKKLVATGMSNKDVEWGATRDGKGFKVWVNTSALDRKGLELRAVAHRDKLQKQPSLPALKEASQTAHERAAPIHPPTRSQLETNDHKGYLNQILDEKLAWSPIYQKYDPKTGNTSGPITQLASPLFDNVNKAKSYYRKLRDVGFSEESLEYGHTNDGTGFKVWINARALQEKKDDFVREQFLRTRKPGTWIRKIVGKGLERIYFIGPKGIYQNRVINPSAGESLPIEVGGMAKEADFIGFQRSFFQNMDLKR